MVCFGHGKLMPFCVHFEVWSYKVLSIQSRFLLYQSIYTPSANTFNPFIPSQNFVRWDCLNLIGSRIRNRSVTLVILLN